MSASVLVSGAIYRTPERKTAKSGMHFVAATIIAKDGERRQFWRVVAFGEAAQGELLQLREGDAVAVQGPMKAELYRPEGGEARVNLSCVAERVLALRGRDKPETDHDDLSLGARDD